MTELASLESRVESMNENTSVIILEKSLEKLEKVEGKTTELWEARLQVMRYVASPQSAQAEMVAGRQLSQNLTERINQLRATLMGLEMNQARVDAR